MNTAIAGLFYNQPQLVESMQRMLFPRLWIIDNGSDPPLECDIGPLVRIEENRFFAGGWNEVMHYFQAFDYVAMLNSDINDVTVAMLDEMAATAHESGYAAISPSFNSPHEHMHRQSQNVRRVSWLDWTAVVMSVKAWNDVGGFNDSAFPGYGADLDLCYRLKQAGYSVAVDDRFSIMHQGSVTALGEGLQHIQGNVEAMNKSFQRLYGVPGWTAFVDRFL